MNNKTTKVWNPSTTEWQSKKWLELSPGDIIKLESESEAPADIVLMHCSNKSGVVFVDTMNLDGETNLKERLTLHEHLD
jgi:P-type E1-E2 ATPase